MLSAAISGILSSLVEDYRRDSSRGDELEELAGQMVEDSVCLVALPGSALEFEPLMKAHGLLETRKEQEITGDDDTMS